MVVVLCINCTLLDKCFVFTCVVAIFPVWYLTLLSLVDVVQKVYGWRRNVTVNSWRSRRCLTTKSTNYWSASCGRSACDRLVTSRRRRTTATTAGAAVGWRRRSAELCDALLYARRRQPVDDVAAMSPRHVRRSPSATTSSLHNSRHHKRRMVIQWRI